MRFIFLMFVFCGLPFVGHGQDTLPKPEGQTVVNLSATEQISIPQNLLTGTFKAQARGLKAQNAQNQVNQLMVKALQQVKRQAGLQAETGQYYVRPFYSQKQKPNGRRERVRDGWESGQSLIVKSTNTAALLKTASTLQEMGLLMQGLAFQVAPEKVSAIREGLIEKAILKIKAQAKRVAGTLGKKKVLISELNIGSGPIKPMPYRAMHMAETTQKSGFTAPVAAPGQEVVSLRVHAKILIGP